MEEYEPGTQKPAEDVFFDSLGTSIEAIGAVAKPMIRRLRPVVARELLPIAQKMRRVLRF